MQTIALIALRQLGLWLLSSTFRQTVGVVKKWVDAAETSGQVDKKTFAFENIKRELYSAGIQIAKGVASDARSVTLNEVNALIEKFASRYP